MVSNANSEQRNRLIVLVPDCLAGNMDLAHKVFKMANHQHCDVFYLALVDSGDTSSTVTRSMATMNAMTSGENLEVQSKIAESTLWLNTLREIYHPGDRIVCYSEQSVKNGFLKTLPVTDFLHKVLDAPVITISGVYHPQRAQVNKWLRSLAAWLGFLVILIGFSVLEVNTNLFSQTGFGQVMLCIIVALEIGAIYCWDRIIGP